MRRAISPIGWLGALWAAGVIGVTACGSAPSSTGSSNAANLGQPTASVAAVDSQTTTTSAAVPPTSTTIAPTTTVPVPANLVEDCVAYVQFGAFTGNSLLAGMWNDAGQDVAALESTCEGIGRTDSATLRNMSAQWADVQSFIAASETTAPTIPKTSPTLPPPPPVTEPATDVPDPVVVPIAEVPDGPDLSTSTGSCGDDSYINVDGNCIPSPVDAPSAPAGATAQCNDGTYSFSAHRSGTCSHHGGVAQWL